MVRNLRCIIAGGRDITDKHLVFNAVVRSGFMYEIAEVVCGGAKGGDDFGDLFAFEVGVPVQYFVATDNGVFHDIDRLRNKRLAPDRGVVNDYQYENILVASDWQRDGSYAGPMRNARMAAYADALIAIWDGKSTGTKGMIGLAEDHGLRIHVERIDEQENGRAKEAARAGNSQVAQHQKASHRPTLPPANAP